MSEVNAKRRITALLLATATSVAAVGALPGAATAGSYVVVSCNSAGLFGYNASAWAPYSNAGSTYEACPTNGGFTAGVSNRMTGQSYAGSRFSGHAFTAPPGTTITRFRWAGRMSRNNCSWGTFIRALPSNATLVGFHSGHYCAQNFFDNTKLSPLTFPLPPGTTRLEQLAACGASQCAPGAAVHSHLLEVRIDDPQPPAIALSGPLASGQWVSGRTGKTPEAYVTAADSTGVRRIEAVLGGHADGAAYACNWSQTRPCVGRATASMALSVADLSDGRHTLSASAFDAASNATSVTRTVLVDNTPPDPVLPEVAGGTGWRRKNGFAVSWTNPPNTAAPITRAHWKLCKAPGECPWRGQRAGQNIQDLAQVFAPGPGEFQLYVWLEDAAGNQREAGAPLGVPLRFDPDPPELAFGAPDPADPLRISVNAIDRHSGIGEGEIEMRSIGGVTWHGLPTVRAGSQLVGYVDDERFRRGTYEFRARAVDRAGNEASTRTRIDGSAATLRLPARVDTRLRVGLLRTSSRARRRRVRTRLDPNFVARYGNRVRLNGQLTNADGQPIDGATVEALRTDPDGSTFPIGLATTGSNGRFRYILRATRNRDVLFHYAGSRRIGAATAAIRMRVPATSSIRANRRRVRNGQQVRFAGQVASRPLPPHGKLVEMQAHFRGRWRTFSTIRTDRNGLWQFPYRFGATVGRVTYRFRAGLPVEGDYPFVRGHSRTAKVLVIGP